MKRVRIMFINCPTLAVDAASFLLLAQNKVQSAIEFEVVHHWVYGSLISVQRPRWRRMIWRLAEVLPNWRWLDRRIRKELDLRAAPAFGAGLTHQTWYGVVRATVDNYDRWFLASTYNKFDTQALPTIIITETKLEGGYMGYSRHDLAVVSLAGWRGFFKPGSALEYILAGVQRYTLRLLFKNIGSHYATRGCIWDFDVHQPDSRIAAYLGMLCSTCKGTLSTTMTVNHLQEVEALIGNGWIGSSESPTSTSSHLGKIFLYPLRRSTGLRPGLLESLSQGMRTEFGKFVFDILKVVLAALATLYVASKFPEVYQILGGKI